jgi:hypothetical protein
METKKGICNNCKDGYDEPIETELFLIKGRWICGDCANTWEHEAAEHLSRYGEE